MKFRKFNSLSRAYGIITDISAKRAAMMNVILVVLQKTI
jgi:hypothetical protein